MPAELDKYGLAQWPMVMGGIVPVVNLEGIKPGELYIDGTTLADIFMGKITKWDDAGDARSSTPTSSCRRRRSPSSTVRTGRAPPSTSPTIWPTSAPTGRANIGVNTSVEWPVGIGAKGNEGVANNVQNTKGSIGYVEYAYAMQNKMTYAGMINKDGKQVQPTAEAFAAAAANADWKGTPGYAVILANQPGADTWPMTAATFILMYKQPADPAASAEALKFFAWAYAKGDDMAKELIYIPMPDSVVKDVEAMWASDIVGPDGKPVYAAM